MQASSGDAVPRPAAVQHDWNNREVVAAIQMQILKMTEFLNRFNLSTRHRLASIDKRVAALQRQLEYLERTETGAGRG